MPDFLRGRLGKAEGAISGEVTKWEATIEADKHSFGTSSSNGWKYTVAGNRLVTGSVTIKATGNPSLPSDGSSTLTLEVDPATEGGASLHICGPAILTATKVTCNIDTGEPVEVTYDFVSDGEWQAGPCSSSSSGT
jgi:hypothetical protein